MVDVARRVFAATGRDIVVAVVDSGVDGTHPHFRRYRNLELPDGLRHADLTALKGDGEPLVDRNGHGTMVAGIVAGENGAPDDPVTAEVRRRTAWGTVEKEAQTIPFISGMAPEARILSLKALNDDGNGPVSNVLSALQLVHEMNGQGRFVRVHVVLLALGFDYEAEWFACGQSPLCAEVDRLVKNGVLVVTPAGNDAYVYHRTMARGSAAYTVAQTITDPGNAELAITVGSTHRELPQQFGVSYFSSRGPTADGRAKPDLVAPGERIIAPRSSQIPSTDADDDGDAVPTLYTETSGTAAAAAHVAGIAAAYMSVRREAIGNPLAVKEMLKRTAVDLRRNTESQGGGLVNLLSALQGTADMSQTVALGATPARQSEPWVQPPAPSPSWNAGATQGAPAVKPSQAVTLFCSYAKPDARLRKQFERSIVHLLQAGRIDLWHDDEILAGTERDKTIKERLAAAQLIVLLISPDYLQTAFLQTSELDQALQRHRKQKARVIPILLRPIPSLGPLDDIEALPQNDRPVTLWSNRDSAWVDVAEGVERALNELVGR